MYECVRLLYILEFNSRFYSETDYKPIKSKKIMNSKSNIQLSA